MIGSEDAVPPRGGLLEAVSGVEGFLAASLVDPLTATVLDALPATGEAEVQVTASGAADVMHALMTMIAQLASGAVVEDVVVTSTTHLHLIRVVEPAPDETALLVVTLDRERSRLAMALREVRDAGTGRAR